MRRRCSAWLEVCAFSVIAAVSAGTTAIAAGVEDFYRGKNVNVVIGYSAGGGYDIYARMLARYLGKYIPGKPTVIPQNMPGAGSLKALEYLLNVAPKDGLTFGTFGRSLPLSPLLEGAKYDATRFEWMGSITADTSTCLVWKSKGITRMEDLATRRITVGGLAKGSDPDIFSAVARNALGFKLKLVTGYPGTKDLVLALERGEIDGICGYTLSSVRSSNKTWLSEDKIVFLAQIGLERDRFLPNVPLLAEFAKTDVQRKALELISLSQTVARPFALPPGTPKDRANAMRNAFMETMRDPGFLAEAKSADLEVNPYSGEQVADLLRKAYASPPEVVAAAVKAIGD